MPVCYACCHASVIEIYNSTIILDIPVLQKQVRKICAPLLIWLVRMEVLPEFVLKYFMRLHGLCTRLLEADDGMQAHLCVHIFMDGSGAVAVSFALQIDCHTAAAVNTVVPVADLFNFLLHFCLLGHNNLPSGVSGSCSKHLGRSPAVSTASGCRILHGVDR